MKPRALPQHDYKDEISRFDASQGWKLRRAVSAQGSSEDDGYDSDGSNCSNCSFQSANSNSTNSESARDHEVSPRKMRSTKSLKWLKTTMKKTAVKTFNYLPGAQCLPSHQCLLSRQPENDQNKKNQEPAVPCASKRGGLPRVTSAPAELAPKEEREAPFYTSKMFGGENPFINVIVSGKPSDKNVKVVRFVALGAKFPTDVGPQLTDFLSDLLDPSQWPFEFIYDLRAMPVPRLHMIIHLARWGSDSKRRDYFIKRCVGCRIILSPGMMFNITQASCVAFFKVCPPTCNTYLLTEDSEPGLDTHFFPPPKALVERREREAKKLENQKNSRAKSEAVEGVISSAANPQDSSEQVDEVVSRPFAFWSWFAGPVQKACGGPPGCLSFLAASQQSQDSAELAQLTQTMADQQKAIEVLTKRMSVLEGTTP